jgi:SAM-dependent methyltransferase
VVADGGRLPLADLSVAVTVCNSVIEHVDDPAALARETRRVGEGFFLQTPNGGFPFETHSFIPIPCYSLIPWTRPRRFVCRVFGADFEYVSSVHYLPEQRLGLLFPEARIIYEKVLGLKKSFYVYHPEEAIP